MSGLDPHAISSGEKEKKNELYMIENGLRYFSRQNVFFVSQQTHYISTSINNVLRLLRNETHLLLQNYYYKN